MAYGRFRSRVPVFWEQSGVALMLARPVWLRACRKGVGSVGFENLAG